MIEGPYCASATPNGISGIAVLRVAGSNSIEVVDKIFKLMKTSKPNISFLEMEGYTSAFGVIVNPKDKTVIDQVLVTKFVAPHSYTGEDLVEISCHGSTAVVKEILNVLLTQGARIAQPGEFTKRAFLNGKIDLSQAEAVMDVIEADSRLALAVAEHQLAGGLKKILSQWIEKLYVLFAALEMIIEFPEHDDTPENANHIQLQLSNIKQELEKIGKSYAQGQILKNGFTIVLAGKPNSGKSSFLNYLAGFERAIVTNIPGTTRDTIEWLGRVKEIPVRVVDTAGIRETEDFVESLGVERSKDALKAGDLVLWLADAQDVTSGSVDVEDLKILSENLTKNQSLGVIITKSDLMTLTQQQTLIEIFTKLLESEKISLKINFSIAFSVVTGENFSVLENKIYDLYEQLGEGQSSHLILTNMRQYNLINKALEFISQGLEVLVQELPAEILSSLLRGALDALEEITGESVSDQLVETIFSRFCIGK